MPGKARPSLREKTLENVKMSKLSETDKKCIIEIFKRYEELTKADIEEVIRCKNGKRKEK